ncbi:MAG: T9SS type A sorting domain-containing protein [Bacteroidetes bacterium]|nr:T9SS type A sorting domain-containing protein [Bacteroidota bacterium]
MRIYVLIVMVMLLFCGPSYAQQGDGGRWQICRLDSIYEQAWDTTAGIWVPLTLIHRTHDADRYLIRSEVQRWDGSAWPAASQVDSFSYDVDGNFVNDVTRIWNGTVWTTYQATYSYDAAAHRTGMVYQSWNGTGWDNLQQNTYSYDANGYLTGQETQVWSASQWISNIRYTYTNNANGLPTLLLIEVYSSGQWTNYSRYTYSYDGSGYETSVAIDRWDGTQFQNQYRETFANNASGFHNEMLTEWYTGSGWRNHKKSTYYHECTAAGIREVEATALSVYPNPFTDHLDVSERSPYRLYDMLGQEVYRSAGAVGLSSLPAGQYTLLTGTGAVRVTKINK